MYLYIYLCICTSIHISIYIFIYTYIHLSIHICKYQASKLTAKHPKTPKNISTPTNIHTHTHAYLRRNYADPMCRTSEPTHTQILIHAQTHTRTQTSLRPRRSPVHNDQTHAPTNTHTHKNIHTHPNINAGTTQTPSEQRETSSDATTLDSRAFQSNFQRRFCRQLAGRFFIFQIIFTLSYFKPCFCIETRFLTGGG